jgi:hypothetical protein
VRWRPAVSPAVSPPKLAFLGGWAALKINFGPIMYRTLVKWILTLSSEVLRRRCCNWEEDGWQKESNCVRSDNNYPAMGCIINSERGSVVFLLFFQFNRERTQVRSHTLLYNSTTPARASHTLHSDLHSLILYHLSLCATLLHCIYHDGTEQRPPQGACSAAFSNL